MVHITGQREILSIYKYLGTRLLPFFKFRNQPQVVWQLTNTEMSGGQSLISKQEKFYKKGILL